MIVKRKRTNNALEPIDIYGNWKIRRVKFERPKKPYGLRMGSKFKIMNIGSEHVLVKKSGVGWDGPREIPLTVVEKSNKRLFKANLRLTGDVTFRGDLYEASFGSQDSGKSLKVQVVSKHHPQTEPGGTSTAGRGG